MLYRKTDVGQSRDWRWLRQTQPTPTQIRCFRSRRRTVGRKLIRDISIAGSRSVVSRNITPALCASVFVG